MEYLVIALILVMLVGFIAYIGTSKKKRSRITVARSRSPISQPEFGQPEFGPEPEEQKQYCFASDKDLASYESRGMPKCCFCFESYPRHQYWCIKGTDPNKEFIQSTTPEFQSRGVPFPDLRPLPPKDGYHHEYLY